MKQQHFSLTITPSFEIQISKVQISQFLIILLYVHMIKHLLQLLAFSLFLLIYNTTQSIMQQKMFDFSLFR